MSSTTPIGRSDPVTHPSPISSATLGTAMADPTVVELLRVEEPTPGEGRRHVVVRWSDGSTGRALSYFADEILVSEGDHGNSRLMSPRAEMDRAAGSVCAPSGT
jgi:hypothetical protein